MSGTIIKRGTYSVVVDQGRDPITGKRLRHWHSGFATRRQAEEARADIVSRANKGLYVAPTKITFGHFLKNEWLPAIKATVRPSTYQSYESNVLNHIVPKLGSILLQALSPSHLNTFYAERLQGDAARGVKGLSAKTVHYLHTIVHKALRDAVKWNRLARNVAEAADPPRHQRSSDMVVWTAAQLRAFLDSVREHRLFAAFLLAASTGLRRGELLGLRWTDIELNEARLAVRHTIVSVAYKVMDSTPKTKKGQRQIMLDRATVAALRDHKARQTREHLAAGPAWTDCGLVFTKPDGTPIHPDGFSKLFQDKVAATDLPRISLHGLRHTHATLALQAGAHPKIVSERLGHANIGITLDTYSHVVPSMQERIAQEVADMVLGAN